MTANTIQQRAVSAIKKALPGALRTAWWMVRLVILVSLGVEILRYVGIIDWMSVTLTPLFNVLGLPGEASLAFISGYFVNVYTAVAVIASLGLDGRAATILAVMVLCAHNMIIESAVQKKCGSSLVRMFIIRTLSAIILGFALHALLPAHSYNVIETKIVTIIENPSIWILLKIWMIATFWLIIKMVSLIVGLSIVQRLLSEFGAIRLLSKLFRPLLVIFGLPARTSFLWIVANILGLAYGAAIMMEETEQGKVSRKDADLLNHHIGVSHSNLEDISLLYATGALFWWMLLSRWGMSIILVWERKLEYFIKIIQKERFTKYY
jgi:hypothetical protein